MPTNSVQRLIWLKKFTKRLSKGIVLSKKRAVTNQLALRVFKKFEKANPNKIIATGKVLNNLKFQANFPFQKILGKVWKNSVQHFFKNQPYNTVKSNFNDSLDFFDNFGPWWFKREVAVYKKQRLIIPQTIKSGIKSYFLRPFYLYNKHSLRAHLFLTPILRLVRKVISSDLGFLYNKKINVIYKWVLNSNVSRGCFCLI